jgi:hypothetical protein
VIPEPHRFSRPGLGRAVDADQFELTAEADLNRPDGSGLGPGADLSRLGRTSEPTGHEAHDGLGGVCRPVTGEGVEIIPGLVETHWHMVVGAEEHEPPTPVRARQGHPVEVIGSSQSGAIASASLAAAKIAQRTCPWCS